jgi:two-component system nitrogen regulation sensor histidine kinase NtrY
MKDYQKAEDRDRRRRRRERYIIIVLLAVICTLLFAGLRYYSPMLDLPVSGSIFVFVLININVILLLLLLFLTVRNLVKLFFERRRNIMGSKLRTKLVLAFVTLSLLPTIILFFASVQFISYSIDYWYNLQIEQSLINSLEVGQDYYAGTAEEMLHFGNGISSIITYDGSLVENKREKLKHFIEEKRKEYRLSSLMVYAQDLTVMAESNDHRIDLSPFRNIDEKILTSIFKKGEDSHIILSAPQGDLVCGIAPIFSRTKSKAVVGIVLLSRFVPGTFVNRLRAVSKGLQEYRQLNMLRKPFKISHLIWLSIVTLLIIFSSVWFGFYLSKGITIPIKELAEGTKRIAAGDYDFSIDLESKDEIGVLVNSFNKMTLDLKTGKNRLEEANRELIRSNFELEQRRLYMETVLENVAAGVISANSEGMIYTINKSAERMLNIKGEDIVGKNYEEVLQDDYIKWIDEFMEQERITRKGFVKREVNVSVRKKSLTLLISLNVLRDERGVYLGLVAVLEDLTEIQKAQRMAAWREVARRIAHEVKNPLTPIQLSAQRLKKRYGGKLKGEDDEILQDCTEMIVRQVEGLKKLVNEFSNFARMPASNPEPADIKDIIRESLSLYIEAHRDVNFIFNDSETVPILNLDKEQIKRVMINLFDNAIEAINGSGELEVTLKYDEILKMVSIEVVDNGAGIPTEHKQRLFEPYFSTKKQGTGLGLSIVDTIVADHNGFIRVLDNRPNGTKFIIELPVNT